MLHTCNFEKSNSIKICTFALIKMSPVLDKSFLWFNLKLSTNINKFQTIFIPKQFFIFYTSLFSAFLLYTYQQYFSNCKIEKVHQLIDFFTVTFKLHFMMHLHNSQNSHVKIYLSLSLSLSLSLLVLTPTRFISKPAHTHTHTHTHTQTHAHTIPSYPLL